MSRCFIHLPKHQLRRASPDSRGFYGDLYRHLASEGVDVRFCEREFIRAHETFEPEAFHFVHQGLVVLPNALNTGPSYLRDFWYADPRGVFGESSIRDMVFDPATVPDHRAEAFFGWLQKRIANKRLSKHTQPQERAAFGQGHVAVFLQGDSLPVMRAAHMSEVEMVQAILDGVPDRDILVKRHPRNEAPVTWAALQDMARGTPRLKLVDANLHDMLQGAVLSCSISSSVSVEAMLHRVPAMVFGRTDFHHCAVTIARPEDVAEGFEQALSTDWPFEHFLFWFFRGHCLDERARDWFGKLKKRMTSLSA
ncbi:hypothetical protein [Shimia sp. SDUM112013]|uniref:hypothetical protein n=1 Tax=Shimia sp. SDUM112013 TaxID=3136160 RepID=UPI0032EAC606